jgi:hypothetical protein
MHHVLLAGSSYICIVASHHLGTLDARCEELKDMMLELDLKTAMFGRLILKMEGPLECMPRVEMFRKTVQAN